jgi:putative tricarboxylic transport membrane protein
LIKDFMVAFLVLVGTLSLYICTLWAEEPRSMIFPKVILMIMAVLSALLLLQSLLMKKPAGLANTKSFPFSRALLCFLLIVIYLFCMESVGFYLSSFLFYIAVTFILGRRELDIRKGLSRIGISALFTVILYILFNRLLVVQTPKGLLF